jgi:hypothetical protein
MHEWKVSLERVYQSEAIRKKRDGARVAMLKPLTDDFPMNESTTMPVVEKQGVSGINFGGHHL